jgi:hypothetical protein
MEQLLSVAGLNLVSAVDPGVRSAGFAAAVPMDGNDPNWDQILIEGKNYQSGEPALKLYNYVSPGFFKAMGTRLAAGRDLTWDDVYNLRPMVLVSENFARQAWGSSSVAIGKRIRHFTNKPWQELTGVVEDIEDPGNHAPGWIFVVKRRSPELSVFEAKGFADLHIEGPKPSIYAGTASCTLSFGPTLVRPPVLQGVGNS